MSGCDVKLLYTTLAKARERVLIFSFTFILLLHSFSLGFYNGNNPQCNHHFFKDEGVEVRDL